MMPVAGQDAVLDAAALERETHMRAAIVERDYMPAVVHQQDRAMAAMHDEPSLDFQLFQAARVHEISSRGIHGGSSGKCPRQRHSAGAFSNVNPASDLPHRDAERDRSRQVSSQRSAR